MKYIFFHITLLFILFSCHNTQKQEIEFTDFVALESDTSFSVFSQNKEGLLIENSLYKKHDFQDKEHKVVSFVLKITEKLLQTDKNTKTQIDFSPVFSNTDIQNWKIQSNADNYTFNKNILTLEYLPKDSNFFDNAYQLYNLKNGNLLISYTYGVMEVNFSDNYAKRFFGFLGKSSTNPSDKNLAKQTLGVFSYASNENSIKKIELKVKSKNDYEDFHLSAPVLEFEVDTTNQNYQKLSEKSLYYNGIDNPIKQAKEIDFSVKATFFKGKSYKPFDIIIPIKEDKIDVEGIIFDKEVLEIIFP